MNIGSKILDFLFPEGTQERIAMRSAIHQNRQETDQLTKMMQEAAFRPDKTMRLRAGSWAEKK